MNPFNALVVVGVMHRIAGGPTVSFHGRPDVVVRYLARIANDFHNELDSMIEACGVTPNLGWLRG